MGGQRAINRCLRPTLFVMMIMWSFSLFFVCEVVVIEARLLSAYEQAIGKWNVTLHRKMSPRFFDTVLFPPIHPAPTIKGQRQRQRQRQPLQRTKRLRRLPKTMDCTLVLRSDGTFVLEPPPSFFHTDKTRTNHHPLNHKNTHVHVRDDSMDESDESVHHVGEPMGMRGRWKLVPNPYCITDRQYDELTLYSHPRVQWNWRGDKILKRARLELRCRIWGRYGAKSIRSLMGMSHGRSKARITHGSLLYIANNSRSHSHSRNTNNSSTNKRYEQRRVCATFSARPSRIMTSLPIMEEEETDDENDEFHLEPQ